MEDLLAVLALFGERCITAGQLTTTKTLKYPGGYRAAAAAANPLKGMAANPTWAQPPYKFPSTLDFYYISLGQLMFSMTNFSGINSFLEPMIAASASRSRMLSVLLGQAKVVGPLRCIAGHMGR